MDRETAINLLNSALDVLFDCFGAEWLIDWGLENDMSDEDILCYLIDNAEILEEVKRKRGEENED